MQFIMNSYVFDLDNTIIMTDELNNKAYNCALAKFNLPPLKNEKRITREAIAKEFPFLPTVLLMQIIREKQHYFLNNLHLTKLNTHIRTFLKEAPENACVLWTKAEPARVVPLLIHHNLINFFSFIFISDKSKITDDIQIICQKMDCKKEELFFWDDDLNSIARLKQNGIKNIFHVG